MDEETESILEQGNNTLALYQERKRRQEGENLLMALPQGEGSGLNADLLDGKHATDLIHEAREGFVIKASGSGGGGVTDHGNLNGLMDNDHPQYALIVDADADYVNVSGDSMTGDLNFLYDDGATSVAGAAIKYYDGITQSHISLSYDDTGYGGSMDSDLLILNSSGALLFLDQDSNMILGLYSLLATGTGEMEINMGGDFANSLFFSVDSTFSIGETATRPAYIYTDAINLGTGAAGAHLTFRVDSQTDFGGNASRSRMIYTDGINVGSGVAGATSSIVLRTDNQTDIGTDTIELRDIFVDGTAYMDTIRVDQEIDIDGAITVDGIDVAGAGAGAFQRAIPVTYSGGTGYVYIYNTA